MLPQWDLHCLPPKAQSQATMTQLTPNSLLSEEKASRPDASRNPLSQSWRGTQDRDWVPSHLATAGLVRITTQCVGETFSLCSLGALMPIAANVQIEIRPKEIPFCISSTLDCLIAGLVVHPVRTRGKPFFALQLWTFDSKCHHLLSSFLS